MKKYFISFIVALQSICFAAKAELKDDLWFFADFDSQIELNGGIYPKELPTGDGVTSPGFVQGRFGKGYAFMKGGNISERSPMVIGGKFPMESGAITMWVKSLDGVDPEKPLTLFWNSACQFDGKIFKRWRDSGGWLYLKELPPRTNEWHHIAFVWDKDVIGYYYDGEKKQDVFGRKYPKTEEDYKWYGCSVGIGFGDHKSYPADAAMDEVAIFKRALSDDEVMSLAKATKGLFDGDNRLQATNPAYPHIYRNEPNAALRFEVYAPKAGEYTFSGIVGDKPVKDGKVQFKTGKNDFDVPVEASRYTAGEYDWSVSVNDASGKVVLAKSGKLTVHPRFERDGYKVLSWGPHAKTEAMHKLGINTVNAHPYEYQLQQEAFGLNMGLSMRSINWRTYLPYDFNEAKIHRDVRNELEPMRNLYSWTMTLQNTEYFSFGHIPYSNLLESAVWRPFAEASYGKNLPENSELGKEPMHWNWWRPGMNWGGDVPKGVFHTNGVDFCSWFYREGNPMYIGNKITQKELHRLSPGNICWAEPIIESWNIGAHHDLICDWLYNYWTSKTLRDVRSQYAWLRPLKKPYMPLPSMAYEHDAGLGVVHPTRKTWNGKPAAPNPAKSADEVLLNCWIAVGAVPAHAIGFFDPRAWDNAINDTPKPRASADDPVKFAREFKEKFLPAAELLQDMPNVRAPIAFAYPVGNRYIDGWLSQTHISRYLELASQYSVPWDFLSEDELTPEIMGQYRYVVMPAARIFTPEEDAAIKATPKTTEFVFDGRCPKDLYPESVHFNTWPEWQKEWRWRVKDEKANIEFRTWYTNRLDELRDKLSAKSDKDGEFSALTFHKEYNGARYIVVVNDLRTRLVDGAQENYQTNAWYRPHGAPQTITTTLPVFEGGSVYEFGTPSKKGILGFGGPGNESVITRDYAAAEAKVFCIYPKALKAPTVKLEGDTLVVTITDKDGKVPSGREIIELTVTDENNQRHDSSGRYLIENGVTRIPLYIADSEREAFVSGQWKVTVCDLITGLEVSRKLH